MANSPCMAAALVLLAAATSCARPEAAARREPARVDTNPPEYLDAEAFELLVPEPAKKALGLGASASLRVRVPQYSWSSEALRQRAAAVATCVPPGPIWIAVRLGTVGRAEPATAAVARGPAPACVKQALSSLGSGPEGGGVVVLQVFGEAPAPAATPADQVPTSQNPMCCHKPHLVDETCVTTSVRIPESDFSANTGRVHTAMFAIRADGTIGGFNMLSPTTAAAGVAIARAVRGCAWTPGRCSTVACADPRAEVDSRPLNMWVILPIRLNEE